MKGLKHNCVCKNFCKQVLKQASDTKGLKYYYLVLQVLPIGTKNLLDFHRQVSTYYTYAVWDYLFIYTYVMLRRRSLDKTSSASGINN